MNGMTTQYDTTLRNTWLDSWESTIGVNAKIYVRTGSPPANCAAADTGTLLVEYDMATDWAAAASGGTKALNNLPLAAAAVATGSAGHYRIKETTGTTTFEQGTVTVTGGGGDMTIDAITITSGHTIQITTYTKTAPGA